MPGKKLYKELAALYPPLLKHFGFQHWWPGETRLEIVVGALLTQNTNWQNVEKAIIHLKTAQVLELNDLLFLPQETLEQYIRPSGYYRQKAVRLHNLLRFLRNECSWDGVSDCAQETAILREQLLNLNGIGPETADSIICYGFDRTVFVIDAYTKRILSRTGILAETSYGPLRALFEETLCQHYSNELAVYKDFHAQLVMLAKHFCKTKPQCSGCPLAVTGLCRKVY